MRDITEKLLLFRAAAQTTWNLVFRCEPDGEHKFGDVSRALFAELVEAEAENYAGRIRVAEREYYPHFQVSLKSYSRGTEVLIPREENGFNHWEPARVANISPLARYVGLFDFEQLDGTFRDFQYVETITADGSAILDGGASSRLLVGVRDCVLTDLS